MTIKNRETLVNELAEMLMRFDKDCNQYQTDVYFYYDNRTQTGSLDTFVNVGGNSWLADDHMTIYRDREHYDDGAYSWYQSKYEIADVLEISVEQLLAETRQYHDIEDDEEPDYWEIENYVRSVDSHDYIESDLAAEYAKQAEEVIDNVEAIPYFNNDDCEDYLVAYVLGSDNEVCKLNDYAEKYSVEHEVSIEELRDILIEGGILEYDGYFGGYRINIKAMESEV